MLEEELYDMDKEEENDEAENENSEAGINYSFGF